MAFALLVSVPVFSQTNREEADSAYTSGNFEGALESYKKLVDENGESAEMYYNIGNCYYKLNKVASSILYYERAHLLDPGDKDIRFNLEIARLKTVDKIEPIGEFFLTGWFHGIQNSMSTD